MQNQTNKMMILKLKSRNNKKDLRLESIYNGMNR